MGASTPVGPKSSAALFAGVGGQFNHPKERKSMKNCLNLLKTVSIVAFLIVSAPLFGATPYAGFSEVFPPDPAVNQFFGFAVANTDDVAVVGASSQPSPLFTGTPTNGAVYVFGTARFLWIIEIVERAVRTCIPCYAFGPCRQAARRVILSDDRGKSD
jgi:hypothetical protein